MTNDTSVKNPFENSVTVIINTMAQKKIASGIPVFNLGAGEPKLPMHDILIQGANDAMSQGKTLYPPVSGISELKTLVAEWMNVSYQCAFEADNCLVVNGGKLGIYLLLQSQLSKGDEVIIASPYWVSYPAITKLFAGIPIIVETRESDGWKLTPDQLKKVCSPKAKILIINNGSNPTGSLYTRQELEALLNIAKSHNLLVISDEVYSGLTYDNHLYVSCGSFLEYSSNVVVIQSCSKNFAMTGWRVGFVFANETIIRQLTSLVSQSTSGVATISQWVAIAAFKNEKTINSWVQQVMQTRRDIALRLLYEQFGIKVQAPASSLYIFIALSELGVHNITSTEFCAQLLEDANVALVPGSAFGHEGYIRLSFGADESDLIQGIKMLATYLRKKYCECL